MPKRNDDRRKTPDIWIYILRGAAVVGWILFTLALVLSFYAAPETDYGLARYHHLALRQYWQRPLTGYLFLLLIFSALSSYLCLILANFRSRRRYDSHYFNMTLLFIISVVWVVYIILHIA